MPRFVTQRELYEVRERPSKAYSWKAFLIANISVEIPYQILLGITVFACYYYPIYTRGGIQSSERQGLVLLYCIQLFVFASTYSNMIIAAIPNSETAGAIATLLFSLILVFNGVFQTPDALPGFWIFMWRVSPFTYLVSGIISSGLSGRAVRCAQNELAVMQPPNGQSCGEYLQRYAAKAGGQVYNPESMENCEYCPLSNADQLLSQSRIEYNTRWRNFGLMFAYLVFNICAAVFLYYWFRVHKSTGRTKRLLGKMKKTDGKGSNGNAEMGQKKDDAGLRTE